MTPSQKKVFAQFYDTNESGGSSRWLVAPSTVEQFINSLRKPKCRKCWDKGYHTKLSFYEGYGDDVSGPVHIFGQNPLYYACTCSRGREIDKLRQEYALALIEEIGGKALVKKAKKIL